MEAWCRILGGEQVHGGAEGTSAEGMEAWRAAAIGRGRVEVEAEAETWDQR